ncbi:MAG TPA: aminoglycoside phosphotransferase, partial [Lentisphaeria bacterium]|nr:aminoglycoside phosphotransferase [Lentisphaeria bacterium]
MAQRFQVDGRLVTVEATGSGNVNDTYLVTFRTIFSEERFILQRINTRVFTQPDKVMNNMRLVTAHVHAHLEAEQDDADRIWQLPRVIPAKDGK